MAFDFSTLVTDRTQQDVAYVRQLVEKLVTGTATEAEKAEWNSFTLKGVYNHTDLNRVTAAMNALKAKLEGYGYAVPGYQRIKVPHVLPEPEPTSRLPEGYLELTYIESTGTQCVDTGFKPDQNTRVVMDFAVTSVSATSWLFCGRTAANDGAFGLYSYSSSGKFYAVYGTKQNAFSATANLSKQQCDFDKNTVNVAGETYVFAEQSFESSATLYLLARNTGGTVAGNASAKLYSCQIYDNGTLIRDYVPCINPDGAIGLYDLVTAAFFGNSGTGSFACNLDFAKQTWQQIIDACKSNAVPSIWKVGDQKTMAINGTDYVIDIIGRNHDTYADGSGFAPLTLQLHDCYNTNYSMGVGSNNGGYSSTIMYKTTLPAIKALMPTEVQAAIVPVSKKTSVGSKGTEIEVISCEMFLLSEIEVYGEVVHSVSGEGNQYDYYKNGGNKIKNLDGNATMWRLRSPAAASVYSYCTVNANASNNYVSAGEACGVSFAFCFACNHNKVQDTLLLDVAENNKAEYDQHTWYEFDWPTPATMTVYLLNVVALRSVFAVMASTPYVPKDAVGLMVQEANNIEKILVDINELLMKSTQVWFYSGELFAGEV